ncbi:MAG TPA: IS1380 family transposase, partial [Lacipirellulaceae bacterium]|nr:IS1380 family transposase [Lacipirellulaceae bacterium]
MNAKIRRTNRIRKQLARRKRRMARRLDKRDLRGCDRPAMAATNVRYEVADRTVATAYGGIAGLHQLAHRLGLPAAIDARLDLLKMHLPYHESDHVLNLAYNVLCGGTCLDDLELRRQDEAYLDALGARRLPDPTTAGDFCRRFGESDIRTLLSVFHDVRKKVWAQQPAEFFEQAIVDMDGVVVETHGECKQGIDIAYNKKWGYHPLIVSLANTGEVLSLVNRSGNRPSHEGAAAEIDRLLPVLFAGGFERVLLRGDTDFSQTKHLDRWDGDGRVTFIFGLDACVSLQVDADFLPPAAWKPLERPAKYTVKTRPRAHPRNVKQPIVVERGFKDIRLVDEGVAEMKYKPVACKKEYRLVVVRKNLSIEQSGERLFDDYRYFFYITNDWDSAREEIVFSANDRCDQENLHAQLQGGVRALYAPVDTLLANWAWMVTTSL